MSTADYRVAKHDLFVAINEQQYGASPMTLVDAIEKFTMALMTEAFNAHPVTKPAGESDSATAPHS